MSKRSSPCGHAARHACRGQDGYTLLELLIAAAISGALLGVLFHFAVSAQAAVGVQGEVADLQQRLRVVIQSVRHDLLLAGAGPSQGEPRGPLTRVFAPIVPARLGLIAADPELSFHDDRLTIVYVPDTRAQTRVAVDMVDGASPIAIEGSAPGCPPARACDFADDDRAVIFEPGGAGSAYELFTVATVDTASNTLTATAPLSRPYPAGSRVAQIVQRTYHFDRAGKRLMVYDGSRSDVPVLDHVVNVRVAYFGDPRPASVTPSAPGIANCAYAGSPPMPLLVNLGGMAPKLLRAAQLTDGPFCGQAPNRFDGDLLRVRRVTVTVRLEAESAEFRGTGAAFSTAGFSRSGVKSVPDLEATIDVAPRNMASPW
jgi:prepilin-type N-terminal cleavage/methylation domain-containing protein